MKPVRQTLDIPSSPRPEATGQGTRAPRVIIVGKDDRQRRQVDLRLRRAGFEVGRANDDLDAARLAACDPPDLIVLDRIVSAADVRLLLSQLRRATRTANVPILLLAPSTSRALASTCREFEATLMATGNRKPRTQALADAAATAGKTRRAPGRTGQPTASTESIA